MPKKTREQIKQGLVERMHVRRRRTSEPVIVALIGVSGAGLSTITRELHRRLSWSLIEKNKIRVELRERGGGFTPVSTDEIFYAMLTRIMREHGNAILDSDFADKSKRKRLARFARRFGAWVVYFRVICDRDVMIGRILASRHDPKTDIFKNTVVAIREHFRRLPWHYRWSTALGGNYTLRQASTRVLDTIDTTYPRKWKKRLKLVVKRLQKM